MEESEKSWKLKLRYGKIKTPFKHYTIIGEGIANNLIDGFECQNGNAFMGMKIWAESPDQSVDVFQNIGEQIGFLTNGKIYIYETDPVEPPREKPYGYDINFRPFDEK